MKSPSRPINLHHLTIALLILLGLPDRNQCAPAIEDEDVEGGCYYMFNHYGEGDRILTNEPCLNCTCHNSMLMCYLRVCPFTKPIGQDCTIEKKPDQCCPVITCPQVPVSLVTPSALVTTTSTTTVATISSSEIALLDRGCEMDGKYYPDGAQVASDPNKPCELCYCIRNRTACVMQECILHVEGCKPIFESGVCCPVRYQCDGPMEIETTTQGIGNLISTTISNMFGVVSSTPQPGGCLRDGQYYADGSQIPNPEEDPCNHCYCMRGDIVCAVQECGSPLENEGGNCTAVPPRAGLCCPEKYACQDTSRQGKFIMHTKLNETTNPPMLDDESTGQTTLQSIIATRPNEIGITSQQPEEESEPTTVPSSMVSHKPSDLESSPVGSTNIPTEDETSSTTAPKISNLNNVVSSTTEPKDTTDKEVSETATTVSPILADDKPEKDQESATVAKEIESQNEHEAATVSSASISSSTSAPEGLNTHPVSSTTEAGATQAAEATTDHIHVQQPGQNDNEAVGGPTTLTPAGEQNEEITSKQESSSSSSAPSSESPTTSPSVSQDEIILPQDSITGLPPSSENLMSSSTSASVSTSEKEIETTPSQDSAHHDSAADKVDVEPAVTEAPATLTTQSEANKINEQSSTHGTSAEMTLTTTPETNHEASQEETHDETGAVPTTGSPLESVSSSSTASSSAVPETVHDITASTPAVNTEDEVEVTTVQSRIQEKPASSSSSSPSDASEPPTTVASHSPSEQHDAAGEHPTEPNLPVSEPDNSNVSQQEEVIMMTTQTAEPSEGNEGEGITTPSKLVPSASSTEAPASHPEDQTSTKKVEEPESADVPTTTAEHLMDSTTEKLVMSSSGAPPSDLVSSEAPTTQPSSVSQGSVSSGTSETAATENIVHDDAIATTQAPTGSKDDESAQHASTNQPEHVNAQETVTTLPGQEEIEKTTVQSKPSTSESEAAVTHTTNSPQENEHADESEGHVTGSSVGVEASTEKPSEGQDKTAQPENKIEPTTAPAVPSSETETKAPSDDESVTTIEPVGESSSPHPVSTLPELQSSTPSHEDSQMHDVPTTVAPESHGQTNFPPTTADESEQATYPSLSSEPAASSVATERIIPTTIAPVSDESATVHTELTTHPSEQQHPVSESSASSSQPEQQAGSDSSTGPSQTSQNVAAEASTELPNHEQNIPTTHPTPTQEDIEEKIQQNQESTNEIRPTFNVSSTEGHTVIIPEQQDNNKEPIPVMPLQRENETTADSSSSTSTTSTIAPVTANDRESQEPSTAPPSHQPADDDHHDASENAIEDHKDTTVPEQKPHETTPKVEVSPQPTVQPGDNEVVTQHPADAPKVTVQPEVSETATQQPGVSEGITQQPADAPNPTAQPGVSEGVTHQSGASEAATQQPGVSEAATQQPSVSESATQQSGVSEGVTQQLGVSEGVTQQPGVSEGATQKPGVSEAATHQPSVSEAATQQPGVSEAATHQPSVSEAATQQPGVSEGVTQQPGASEGVTQLPGVSEAATHQPAVSEAATQQPSVISEAATQQPSVSEGVTQQPGVSEGVTQQPDASEGVTQQPSESPKPTVVSEGVTQQPGESPKPTERLPVDANDEPSAGTTVAVPTEELAQPTTLSPVEQQSSSTSSAEPTKEQTPTSGTSDDDHGATTVQPANVPSATIVETATTSPAEELPGTTSSSAASEHGPDSVSQKVDTTIPTDKVEPTTLQPNAEESSAQDSASSSAGSSSSPSSVQPSEEPDVSEIGTTESASGSLSSEGTTSKSVESSSESQSQSSTENSLEGSTSHSDDVEDTTSSSSREPEEFSSTTVGHSSDASVDTASSSSSEDKEVSSTTASIESEEVGITDAPGVRIPGEGSCFVEGITYRNGSRIPPSTPCQLACACQNSIVHCLLVHCPPPPSDTVDCKPIYKAGICCPKYECDASSGAPSVTVTPQPDIIVTPVAGLFTVTGRPVSTTDGITAENKVEEGSTELPVISSTSGSIQGSQSSENPEAAQNITDVKPTTGAPQDETSSHPSSDSADESSSQPSSSPTDQSSTQSSSAPTDQSSTQLSSAPTDQSSVSSSVPTDQSSTSSSAPTDQSSTHSTSAPTGETSSHPTTSHSEENTPASQHDQDSVADQPDTTHQPEIILVEPGSSVAPETSNLEKETTSGAGIVKPQTGEAAMATTESGPSTSTSVESHTEISSVSSSSSSSVASISSMTSSSGPGKANATVSNEGPVNATSHIPSDESAPTVDEKFGQPPSPLQSTTSTSSPDAPSSDSDNSSKESTPLSTSTSPSPLNETDAGSPLEESSNTAGSKYPVTTTTSVTPSPAPWPYPSSSTASPSASMSSGACLFDGRVYMSAQQIPRDDPCDFCFCFRGDIICLQQSCPPPIPGCYEEPIPGFCCPRYECPVGSGNSTTTPPLFPPSYYHSNILNNAAQPSADKAVVPSNMATGPGCEIQGEYYETGQVIVSTSGPCLECRCGSTGMMECDPRECQPEPMLRKMIAAITSR